MMIAGRAGIGNYEDPRLRLCRAPLKLAEMDLRIFNAGEDSKVLGDGRQLLVSRGDSNLLHLDYEV